MHLISSLLAICSLYISVAQGDQAAWNLKGSGLCHGHDKAGDILSSYKASIGSDGPFQYTGSYKIGCWAFNGGVRFCAIDGHCHTSVQSICMVTRDMTPDFKYDSNLVSAYAQELIDHGVKACGSIAVQNNATIGGGTGNGFLSFRYTEETSCLSADHLWDHYTACAFNQQS